MSDSNKTISKSAEENCLAFVKYYPVIMQVIILANIFEEFIPFSFTNWLYPILGHSLAWDLFILAFSKMFRFCVWHRLLIYSMIFNITVEWVMVNFEVPLEYDYIIFSLISVTLVLIIAAVILRFKTGCFEHEQRNSN